MRGVCSTAGDSHLVVRTAMGDLDDVDKNQVSMGKIDWLSLTRFRRG